MASSRKPKRPERELVAHRWLTLVVGIVACSLAAFPVHWNYNCRYHGKLCENSFLAPGRLALDASKDQLTDKLIDEKGRRAFRGLEIKRHSTWFSSDQILVYAKFADQAGLLLDVVAAPQGVAIETFEDTSSGAGGYALYGPSWSKVAARNAAARVVFYRFRENVVRREIEIYCVYGGDTPKLSLKNIHLDLPENRLTFLLASTCDPAVDGIHHIVLGTRYAFDLYSERADLISLILNREFHVIGSQTQAEKHQKETHDRMLSEGASKLSQHSSIRQTFVCAAELRPAEYGRWASPGLYTIVATKVGAPQKSDITKLDEKRCTSDFLPGVFNDIENIAAAVCFDDYAVRKSREDAVKRWKSAGKKEGKDSEAKEEKTEPRRSSAKVVFWVPESEDGKIVTLSCDCDGIDILNLVRVDASRRISIQFNSDADLVKIDEMELVVPKIDQTEKNVPPPPRFVSVSFDERWNPIKLDRYDGTTSSTNR